MFKKILVIFAMCLMATTTVFAGGITTVQVTGNSQQEIEPDIAKISLSITTINGDLALAKNENSQNANQVFAKLKEQGIADAQIKTKAYRIDPMYSYEKDQLPKLTGYKVINSIEVTTTIEKVGDLVNELTNVGANGINAIHFEKSNETSVKNDALRAAVKDALSKAEIIASTLDKHISAVKVVNESGTSYHPVVMESRALKASLDAGSPPIAAGKITVSATVQVTVELK